MILKAKEYGEILALIGRRKTAEHELANHDTALRLAAIKTARDLLEIAELAMPDTYFATDSRVKRAKALLEKLGGK